MRILKKQTIWVYSQDGFSFIFVKNPKEHLKEKDRKTMINLSSFIEEIETAMNKCLETLNEKKIEERMS